MHYPHKDPSKKDNESYLHTGKSQRNPYAPPDHLLKFGTLKGKKEELLVDGKTRIFVADGHDIEKAKAHYNRITSLEYRIKTPSVGGKRITV